MSYEYIVSLNTICVNSEISYCARPVSGGADGRSTLADDTCGVGVAETPAVGVGVKEGVSDGIVVGVMSGVISGVGVHEISVIISA